MLIINRFFILIFCFLGFSTFTQLVEATPIKQGKTLQKVEVFAQIGDKFQVVANLPAKQIVNIVSNENSNKKLTALYLPVQFGNGLGFIPKRHFKIIKKSEVKKIQVLLQAKLTGYILTTKKTSVFSQMDSHSVPIGTIHSGLRYPVMGKTVDSHKNSWYQIRFLNQDGFIRTNDVEEDNGIPILTYHHILKDEENTKFLNTSTTTSVESFRFQLETMKELGFQTAYLDSIEGYLNGTLNLPARLLVITFDDGLSSVYRYGYPLLKEFGFKATMFVITSRIKYLPQAWEPNSLQFLSIQEYHRMKEVFDLQSHTHFLHRYLNQKPIALQRDRHNLLVDHQRSIRELKKRLEADSRYLSYPFGAYNELIIATAKEAGFTLGLTTKIGKVKFGDNPFELKRVYLLKDTSKKRIISILSN